MANGDDTSNVSKGIASCFPMVIVFFLRKSLKSCGKVALRPAFIIALKISKGVLNSPSPGISRVVAFLNRSASRPLQLI